MFFWLGLRLAKVPFLPKIMSATALLPVENLMFFHSEKKPVLGSLRNRFCKVVGVHLFW